jgi:hypothetical protein
MPNDLLSGLDLPIWQRIAIAPAGPTNGGCFCNDKRHNDRYIYLMTDNVFYRYDIYSDSWMQLATPPSFTLGAGGTMCFDPSQGTSGRIWLLMPSSSSPYAVFAYYDIASNVWTSRDASTLGLGSQWATDADLCHTCSSYNATGNDDYIYLIGNGATVWYRYSIAGNSWSTMATPLTGSAGAGCGIYWPFNYDADKLYIMRGGTTATIYVYTISTLAISTLSYQPNAQTFTTGTCGVYDGATYIYFKVSSTGRFCRLKLQASSIMENAGAMYGGSESGYVGQTLAFWKSPSDNYPFLYARQQGGTICARQLVHW